MQIDTIRRSGRARKLVDYTFKEFDDEILDAVETDKKRLKLDDTEMNGHPTGKPAFAVERFYSNPTTGRRRSRRLKDLDSGSDSDSKISDYEYDGSTDDDRHKRPERHVYLRRHIIDDDDDEDDESVKDKTNGKCSGSDDETTIDDNSKDDQNKETKTCSNDNEETAKESGDEDKNKSLDDSQSSAKDNSDTDDTEKSGPTVDDSLQDNKDTTTKDDKDKDDNKEPKKDTLDVPKSKPPPLERISPKVDPLELDALGFGALASCFSSSERQLPSRPEQYSPLRSPSQNIRSPLRPDAGFSTDRLGVPQSPSSSYPRVNTDSRFGSFPPTYDQSSSFTNYLPYNQSNFSSGSTMDTFTGMQSGRQSYPGLNYPGSRSFPGFNPTGISKTSPSYSQPPPYGSSVSGYTAPYPSTDITSRSSYYPSSNHGYSLPTKNPYPPQGYFPDDPFSTGMFYGNPGNGMQQGGVSSWPTHTAASTSYYPSSGMGQNRTGI